MHDLQTSYGSGAGSDVGRCNGGGAGAWLGWLAFCVIAASAIALAGVYTPSVIKKLLLFAIAYGLLTGWIAARLSFTFSVPATKPLATGLVLLVILIGQIGMAIESDRVNRTAQRQRLAADPKQAAALRLLESARGSDLGDINSKIERVRREIGAESTFRDYLSFRVSPLGPRAQRAGLAIWIGEILLGAAAGGWIFRRSVSRGRTAASVTAGQFSSADRLDAAEPPDKLG